MPAINFCRQTQLDFLSAISITYSNTFPALSAVSTIYFEKKKKNGNKEILPLTKYVPCSTSHGCPRLGTTHIPLVKRKKT